MIFIFEWFEEHEKLLLYKKIKFDFLRYKDFFPSYFSLEIFDYFKGHPNQGYVRLDFYIKLIKIAHYLRDVING